MNTSQGNPNQSIVIDIREILLHLWASRRLILIITALIALVGLFYAVFATRWYTATVKILPSNDQQRSGLLSQYSGLASIAGINIPSFNSQFDLYPEIINSNFILDRILKHEFQAAKSDSPLTLFEFWQTKADTTKPNWRYIRSENAKQNLKRNYIISNIDKNGMLTISTYVPEDPVLAANLANFIAKNLDNYNKHYRKYKTNDQIKHIEKSIETSTVELEKAETKMRNFLDANLDLSSPGIRLEMERLKTEYEVQKTIFIELRKQKELAAIEKIKTTETLNILEYAEVPIYPSKPKSFFIVVFSFVFGVFAGSLIATVSYIAKNYITQTEYGKIK
jgi:uncharacterized protein involved in exopolysaccharide biosynthesis